MDPAPQQVTDPSLQTQTEPDRSHPRPSLPSLHYITAQHMQRSSRQPGNKLVCPSPPPIGRRPATLGRDWSAEFPALRPRGSVLCVRGCPAYSGCCQVEGGGASRAQGMELAIIFPTNNNLWYAHTHSLLSIICYVNININYQCMQFLLCCLHILMPPFIFAILDPLPKCDNKQRRQKINLHQAAPVSSAAADLSSHILICIPL